MKWCSIQVRAFIIAIDQALMRTRRLALDGFGLSLRLGAVPVTEILARDADRGDDGVRGLR